MIDTRVREGNNEGEQPDFNSPPLTVAEVQAILADVADGAMTPPFLGRYSARKIATTLASFLPLIAAVEAPEPPATAPPPPPPNRAAVVETERVEAHLNEQAEEGYALELAEAQTRTPEGVVTHWLLVMRRRQL